MVKKRVRFTFPRNLITEPLIYKLGQDFKIMTNVRRADVREDMGWVLLELEGEIEELSRGLKWMTDMGVRVDPVAGDVVEG